MPRYGRFEKVEVAFEGYQKQSKAKILEYLREFLDRCLLPYAQRHIFQRQQKYKDAEILSGIFRSAFQ